MMMKTSLSLGSHNDDDDDNDDEDDDDDDDEDLSLGSHTLASRGGCWYPRVAPRDSACEVRTITSTSSIVVY